VSRATLQGRDRLNRLDHAGRRAVAAMLERSRRRLDGQARLLETLGYHSVLARGFALVRDEDGAMVRRASEVKSGTALDIEYADGHVGAHADARPRKEGIRKKPRGGESEKQGSLL
jgi:exodeoxyribonuclease VII large subunit